MIKVLPGMIYEPREKNSKYSAVDSVTAYRQTVGLKIFMWH